MKKGNLLLTFLATVLIASMSFAQGTVVGIVTDATYGETLIGSTILVKGSTTGTTTDINGYFSIDLSAGSHTLVISYIGYENKEVEVSVKDGETDRIGKVKLKPTSTLLDGVNVIADRAKLRETPVAVSNISKADIEEKLGSQDLPMIMNNTPSVYATPQGGGAGDARINVRGFNQNNVAIMINGVPINDMENGWVYWSNWDGVADATSSIEMQRGLSAINLATPSVGGTMNIITSPAEMKAGGSAKLEAGSGSFFKATLTGHTGLINEKFAASASVVRKIGSGVVDKTWTDAWAYYLGMSYNINKNHRLEVYAVGAPQRHGQNLYKQNVAAYSHELANEIGADSAAANIFESPRGRRYNENWNTVSESYNGEQSWNGKTKSRYDKGFLAERENYFHKPVANLNWYAQWSDKISQFTTVYYSGGKGGGTGTYGKIQYDYDQEPTRIVDWDATIAKNQDPDYVAEKGAGILRNSVNNQYTIGAISKVKVVFNDAWKMQVGLDWRTAQIDHFREVRDLLGATSYDDSYTRNDFGSQLGLGLGDKIAYNNTNTVDWLGGYIQGEYSNGVLSAYGTAGYSMIKYSYVNHFVAQDTLSDGNPDVNSGKLESNSDWITGLQLKGGLNYNFTETFSMFANVGYVSKVPIFDVVIDDGDGTVTPDPQNEKFVSYELGAIYTTLDNKLDVKGNFYYTTWQDRTFTRSVQLDADGTTGLAFIKGLDQRHIGFELEASYRPIRLIGVGAIASIANWKYLNDVSATVKNYDGGTAEEVNIYTKDLKVGDAPQTQFALWVDVYPVKGLYFQLMGRFNSNHYADFNPTNRDDADDREQVWKTPSSTIFDFHANYQLPIKGRTGVNIFAHVFNIFNTLYVQDAVDNSAYNGYYGYDGSLTHTANSAEVFLGLPTTFNVGVKVNF